MNDLREQLAALAHEQWSGWMKYLFSKSQTLNNGDYLVIPKTYWTRWLRQMNTRYEDLSEREQESDRKEADRVLALIGARADSNVVVDLTGTPPLPPNHPHRGGGL